MNSVGALGEDGTSCLESVGEVLLGIRVVGGRLLGEGVNGIGFWMGKSGGGGLCFFYGLRGGGD